MTDLFELSRDELWWIEDKFKRFGQLNREIAMRKIELQIKEQDTNIGGGRSGGVHSPVESQVIKEQSDPFILTRQQWKDGITHVIDTATEEERAILALKYWSNQNYLTWSEVGERFHYSKSKIYDIRYDLLKRFAKKIGYL